MDTLTAPTRDFVDERLQATLMTEDANAILRRVRSSAAAVTQRQLSNPAVSDLVQAIEELDDYLREGGLPPEDWSMSLSRLQTN